MSDMCSAEKQYVYVVVRLQAKIRQCRAACIKAAASTTVPALVSVLPHDTSHRCPISILVAPEKKIREKVVLYFNTMLAQLQILFTSLLFSFQSSFNNFICACVYRAKSK